MSLIRPLLPNYLNTQMFGVSGIDNITMAVHSLPLDEENMILRAAKPEWVVVRFHTGKAGDDTGTYAELSCLGWGEEDGWCGGVVSYLDGTTPSVGLWNNEGKILGQVHNKGMKIQQGSFGDTIIQVPTNAVPEYIAVAAQVVDAICVAGIEIKWPTSDRRDRNLLLGDVGRMCGMPWYHSRLHLANQKWQPACMWLTSDCLRRPRRKPGKDADYADYGNGDFGISDSADPPEGISFHIPSMMGAVVNPATAAQRTADKRFMCGHDSRFKVWWNDYEMSDKFRIPVFSKAALAWGPNMTDRADFVTEESKWSERLKKKIAPYDWYSNGLDSGESNFEDVFTGYGCGDTVSEGVDNGLSKDFVRRSEKSHHRWARETLVKDEQSARELCEDPVSMGADWYSHAEELFCHMGSKTLFPKCEREDGIGAEADCFDTEKNEVRPKKCGMGRVCGRAVSVGAAGKLYKRVEDSRSGEQKK